MNYNEMKLWLANTFVITVSFTDIDNILKFVLMVITIGYSVDKWLIMRKNKKKDDE